MRIELTLDCLDLDATAAFWLSALHYGTKGVIEGRYIARARANHRRNRADGGNTSY